MLTAQALLGHVSDSDDTAYAISRDFRIVAVNAGFTRFALANGAAGLRERWQNVSVLDAIPPILRGFFVDGFERAWATTKPWEHDYECSSGELYRRFHMVAYPVQNQILVIIHSLTVESPHSQASCAPNDEAYATDGFIKMCSHCRRVRSLHGRERWDWVPAYLDRRSNVSHGICQPCSAFYWPASD